MARRGKTGAAGDIVEITARLPWWVGVVLAVAFYVVLHRVAAAPAAALPTPPGPMGAHVVRTLWTTLAGIGQYLLPLLCLVGAAVSAWRRRVRTKLADGVALNRAPDALDGMGWREFEMLVGEGFRRQGYQVVETGGGGADGGVDLVLRRPGRNGSEKFLVQCKQWRAHKVGVDVVRELYGVMAARGAAGGFVVTSGRFTAEAVAFASGRHVTLVDGPKLHGLIRQAPAGAGHPAAARPASTAQPLVKTDTARGAVSSASAATSTATAAAPAPTEAASCPVCSKPMVQRTAKRGANAGAVFWGCTAYPVCRGTRPVA